MGDWESEICVPALPEPLQNGGSQAQVSTRDGMSLLKELTMIIAACVRAGTSSGKRVCMFEKNHQPKVLVPFA